jgi:hypothetical protein
MTAFSRKLLPPIVTLSRSEGSVAGHRDASPECHPEPQRRVCLAGHRDASLPSAKQCRAPAAPSPSGSVSLPITLDDRPNHSSPHSPLQHLMCFSQVDTYWATLAVAPAHYTIFGTIHLPCSHLTYKIFFYFMVFAILSLMAINTAYKPGPLSDVNLEVHAMLNLRSGHTSSGINDSTTLSRFPGTRKMKQVFVFLKPTNTSQTKLSTVY